MNLILRLPASLLLLTLPCCFSSENSSAPACGENMPIIDIGSAPDVGTIFTPIVDGQSVELVHGLQGGFHVWLQLRARNLCPDHLRIHRSTAWSDGNEITHADDVIGLIEASDPAIADEGWIELPAARPAILCPAPKNVVGVPIRLQATVLDAAMRSASAEISVVPSCPTDSYAEVCAAICSPSGGQQPDPG